MKHPVAKKLKEKINLVLKDLREQKKMGLSIDKSIKNSQPHPNNNNNINPNPNEIIQVNEDPMQNMMNSEERILSKLKKYFKVSNKKSIVDPNNNSSPEGNQIQEANKLALSLKTKNNNLGKTFSPDEENIVEEDDDDSFEDEDSQKYEVLKSHRLLLYFSNKQEFLAQEFYDQSCKRTAGHMKIMMGAFIIIYLFQTLIIISVRYFIRNYLTILLIKGGIAFCMIIFLFLIKYFYKSNLMKMLLFLVSLASLVMAVVQGYKSDVKELNTVQSIELVLLFAFTSYLP